MAVTSSEPAQNPDQDSEISKSLAECGLTESSLRKHAQFREEVPMFGGQKKFNTQVTWLLNSHYKIETNARINPHFMGSMQYLDTLSLCRRIKRLNVSETALMIAAIYVRSAIEHRALQHDEINRLIETIKMHCISGAGEDAEVRPELKQHVIKKLEQGAT